MLSGTGPADPAEPAVPAGGEPVVPAGDADELRQRARDFLASHAPATLPKLDYRSEELRRRIYGDGSSVVARWLEPPYSLDGWRIWTKLNVPLWRPPAAQ